MAINYFCIFVFVGFSQSDETKADLSQIHIIVFEGLQN